MIRYLRDLTTSAIRTEELTTFAGNVLITGNTTSTSTSTGSLVTYGGLGVAKNLFVGGTTTIQSTTQSNSTSAGAFIVAGGTGIAKNLNVGGALTVSGATSLTNTLAVSSTASATSFIDKCVTLGSVGNFLQLDLSAASTFKVALSENITQITVTNIPAIANSAVQFVLMLTADSTTRSIVWPNNFKWPNNTAPTLSTAAGKTDILVFISIDAGVTWRGFLAGASYD